MNQIIHFIVIKISECDWTYKDLLKCMRYSERWTFDKIIKKSVIRPIVTLSILLMNSKIFHLLMTLVVMSPFVKVNFSL